MWGTVWKLSLTLVRILFGERLWNGLPASKLQFNAKETTRCVFPTEAPKGASTGLCVLGGGGSVSKIMADHWMLFFLGEDNSLAQLCLKAGFSVTFICLSSVFSAKQGFYLFIYFFIFTYHEHLWSLVEHGCCTRWVQTSYANNFLSKCCPAKLEYD